MNLIWKLLPNRDCDVIIILSTLRDVREAFANSVHSESDIAECDVWSLSLHWLVLVQQVLTHQLVFRFKNRYVKELFCSNRSYNCNVRKRTFGHVRLVKIYIGLRIRTVWSDFSLCTFWITKYAKFLNVDNEHSDQTTRMHMSEGTRSGTNAVISAYTLTISESFATSLYRNAGEICKE